jgi:TolA-binding protein
MRASRSDTENAIAAFHRILDDNPLDRPGAAQWDPAVVHDIHEIEIVSRIALANLYYLSERYADAGSFYRETLEAGELSLDRSLEARLGVARSLYLAGETSAVMEQCAEIFRELSDDPAFWSGERDVDPVFLNVPASLVRMYHEVGDSARANEFATRATDFYERVVAQRPETGVAWQSRLGLLQIALVRREWNVAIERLDGLRQSSSVTAEDHAGLDLLSAEIAAFALRNTADAERQFEAITQRYPGAPVVAAARYDLASLREADGRTDEAMAIYRSLETDRSAPPSVAARAMLSRARLLEAGGAWDDADALYRRVEQLYPYTAAAIEAPIIVTRHYVAAGEKDLARRSLDRARDYYLSLLDRSSPFAGDRLVVQAALAESFSTAGRSADVAELLGAGSPRWDETSAAAGMLRSAEVYERVLGDRKQAVTMLKKCIERYPETRYSKVAQRRLNELEGGPE